MAGQHGPADVLVIGGGVSGLGIAWRAARAGLAVTVVDPSPGRGASWAAAGMLAPDTEASYGEEELLRLTLESARRWPAFAAELSEAAGMPSGYRPCGTLMVARDADDLAALEELHAFQQRLGLRAERLRSHECRRLEPGLAPGIRGGILAESDHQVDNRALVGALLAACERAGVRLRRARATGLKLEGERVTGAVLGDGERLGAGTVVLAAGCWSGTLEGLPAELLPPVRPVKGQLLYLRGPEPLCRRNIRGVEGYLVPRADGRVLVGATVEERGFDTRVTAGAVHDLLRAAAELLPDVAELELVETVAGLRPGSPDNAPLLGPAAVGGLVIAAGHYRNGILLTPVTAGTIAELLVTGRTPELLAAFSPQRFGPAARTGAPGTSGAARRGAGGDGARPTVDESAGRSGGVAARAGAAEGARPAPVGRRARGDGHRGSGEERSPAGEDGAGGGQLSVVVNGVSMRVPDGCTLAGVVERVGRDPAGPGIAVARNGEVVPRSRWGAVRLVERDRVEVLGAAQGG